MQVLIRVDASPAIGIGHAMRCTTLAQALRPAGHEVIVAAKSLLPMIRDRLEAIGVEVVMLDEGRDDSIAQTIAELTPDVCVIDGYHLVDEAQQIAESGVVVAMIDDNEELPVELARVVVNQNLHALDLGYRRNDSTVWLLGAPYALIRSDVVGVVRQGTNDSRDQQTLVCIGGTDTLGLTLSIVNQLMERPEERVVVSLSSQHPDHAPLGALLDRFPERLRRAQPDLIDAFEVADMAIIGGGSTLWEVGFLGIPAVAAIVADNQVQGATAAEQAGFVTKVDCREGEGPAASRLIDGVDRIRRNPEIRRSMSQRGRHLFDGGGAQRVAAALEEATTTHVENP